MLKINGSNIDKIKINGLNIKLGKINNQVIFENAKYTLTYSSYIYNFSASSSDNYSIKYANGNTILEDYDSIAEMTGKSGSYKSLMNLNIAPKNATKVVLVKGNDIKSSIDLPSDFEKITDTPLYSVGLISDTHVDGDGTDTADSINDLKKALTLFKNENVSFIAHCGDVTEDNRDVDYTAYSNAIVNNTIPIKTISGNHDSYSKLEEVTGNSLYYEYVVNDDVYLFLGLYQASTTSPFSSDELSWLETKLSSYKNKRVFLFLHYYCDPVGDANKLDNDELGTTGQALTFRNLMSTYKNNVAYFSGHSHLTYKMQELVSNANISLATDTMPIRVHIPSNGRPRILSNGSITNNYVGCECAIMNVYSNYIVIKGYNLSSNKIMPIAMYKIPFEVTAPIEVNLLKLLKANTTWVSYSGDEASVIFNSDNTLTISITGNGSWGLDITQSNLTLSAGKTYKLSCDNISKSTWISLDERNELMLNYWTNSVEYTPTEDITISKLKIWCESTTAYDNLIWNIKLEEITVN